MYRLFSIKKIIYFALFVAVVFIIIQMFAIYAKDEAAIKDGVLVDAGMKWMQYCSPACGIRSI